MAEIESDRKNECYHCLFISYGRLDAYQFAKKLCEDLKSHGYQTWIDLENIDKGGLFEIRIENAIKKCTVLLAVMSEHSTREESVCRDEVVYALNEGKKVIPLLVIPGIKPTLLLCRRQWIDFTQEYDNAFQQLLKFLQGKSDVLLPPKLPTITGVIPLDFGPEIARYTINFTGRTWINLELDNWLNTDSSSTVFAVIGDPGMGKSSIAAWLSQARKEQVLAIYFCTGRNRRSLDPFEFVASLVSQLYNQLEGYAKAVEEKHPDVRRSTPSVAFRELIIEPLLDIPQKEKKIILIDALNEAFIGIPEGLDTIPELLALHAQDLPPWLKIVATTQPIPELLAMFTGSFSRYYLEHSDMRNLDDIELFIDNRLKTEKFKTIMSEKKADSEYLKKVLIEKSSGNFLYISLVLSAIESGEINPSKPESFPLNLGGFYWSYFKLTYPDTTSYNRIRPILEVILAAREPLSSAEIASYIKKDPLDIEVEMEKLAPFFRKQEGNTYLAFHASLIDWLKTDVGQPSTRFRIDPKKGLEKIIQGCWNEFLLGTKNMHQYSISYLPVYLIEERRFEDVTKVLSDEEFFILVWEKNEFEIKRFWAIIEDSTSYRAIQVYRRFIEAPNLCKNEIFLFHLSEFLTDTNHIKVAISLFEYLILQYAMRDDFERLEWTLSDLAWALWLANDLNRAKQLLIFQEVICRNKGYLEGLQRAFGYMTLVYESESEFQRAFDYYHMQQAICRNLKNDYWLQISLGNEGLLNIRLGNTEKGLQLYQEKLNISKKIGNQQGYQWALNYIASLYQSKGEYQKALEYYQQQASIANKIGYQRGLLLSLNSQIEILTLLKDVKRVAELNEQRNTLQSRILEDYSTPRLPNNDAFFSQVKDHYLELVSRYSAANDITNLQIQFENLAMVALAQSDYVSAKSFNSQIIELTETQRTSRQRLNALRNLWQIHYTTKDYETAFEIFTRNHLLNDPMLFPQELNSYLETSIQYFITNEQYELAESAYLLKEQIILHLDEPDSATFNMLNQVELQMVQNKTEKARKCLERISQSESLHKSSDEAITLYMILNICLEYMDGNTSAAKTVVQTLDNNTYYHTNHAKFVDMIHVKGKKYYSQGLFPFAKGLFDTLNSLTLNTDYTIQNLSAIAHLGLISEAQGIFSDALIRYSLQEKTAKENKLWDSYCWAVINQGDIHRKFSDFSRANEAYTTVVSCAESQKYFHWYLVALQDLGDLARDRADFAAVMDAEQKRRMKLEPFKSTNSDYAESVLQQGIVRYLMGQITPAWSDLSGIVEYPIQKFQSFHLLNWLHTCAIIQMNFSSIPDIIKRKYKSITDFKIEDWSNIIFTSQDVVHRFRLDYDYFINVLELLEQILTFYPNCNNESGINIGELLHLENDRNVFNSLYISCAKTGFKMGEQYCAGVQGLLHRFLGNNMAAYDFLSRQKMICAEIGYLEGQQLALWRLGHVHLSKKESKSALICFEEQEKICRGQNNWEGIQWALEGIGYSEYMLMNFKQALHYFERQEEICTKKFLELHRLSALLNKARALRALGELPASLKMAQQIERICAETHHNLGEMCALSHQYDCYRDLKDEQNADLVQKNLCTHLFHIMKSMKKL